MKKKHEYNSKNNFYIDDWTIYNFTTLLHGYNCFDF